MENKFQGIEGKMYNIDTSPVIKSLNESLKEIFYSELLVQCRLSIEGQEILKSDEYFLKINQEINKHNDFEIIFQSDLLEDKSGYPLNKTREYLGKSITVNFRQFNKNTYTFKGIITDIVNDKFDNYQGNIILQGYSPTIIMDNGEECRSFEGKKLENIIENILKEYPELEPEIKTKNQELFPYTVQYKESDYDFLKRTAERYGEWFYFSGEKVIFGLNQGKEVELVEDKDIIKYELRMKSKPQSFRYISYNIKEAQIDNISSVEVNTGQIYNPFVVKSMNASETIFTKTPKNLINISSLEMGRSGLKGSVERQRKSRANVFEVYVESRNPNIQLGDIIKLKAYIPGNTMLNTVDVPLESYRVIKIEHYHNKGEYYNKILGVPKDQEISSCFNENRYPICEEQSAKVTDNEDIEGMGRIRVQFPWQEPDGDKSPWIRVSTPYGGSGKGFYILPEIGEEVLVGFEGRNAERPYVIASMYNGKETSGVSNAGNDLKVHRFRSGVTTTVNDLEGSILIEDPSGNTWHMDGQGNINVNAPKNISINAGENISINAGENMDINVGKNFAINVGENMSTSVGMEQNISVGNNSTISIGEDYNISTNNIMINAVNDFYSNSSIFNNIASEINSQAIEGDITFNAKNTIRDNSGEKNTSY